MIPITYRLPSIPRLLFASGPFAVFWAVIPVIVDSLYRVFWGDSSSHICEEPQKVVGPLGAHFNSAPTVVLPSFAQRIGASSTHRLPDLIFRRSGLPVDYGAAFDLLLLKATARARGSMVNLKCGKECRFPAIALELVKPNNASAFFCWPNKNKAIVSLPSR